MNEILDKRFLNMKCKRSTFTGKVDELKVIKATRPSKLRVTFVDVIEKGTNKPFRQHVHVLLDSKKFHDFFKNNQDNLVTFNAEVYTYNKKPKTHKNGLYYGSLSLGLKNITSVKIENKIK